MTPDLSKDWLEVEVKIRVTENGIARTFGRQLASRRRTNVEEIWECPDGFLPAVLASLKPVFASFSLIC